MILQLIKKDGCQYCDDMEMYLNSKSFQTSFPSSTVKKMDITPELSKKYNINIVPFVVILSDKGKYLGKIEGMPDIVQINAVLGTKSMLEKVLKGKKDV